MYHDHITLISCDGARVRVPTLLTKQSNLIQTILEADTDTTEITLHSIRQTTLEHVVYYMTHNTLPDLFYTRTWNRTMTYDLLEASDYMIIPSLLGTMCKYIIDMMKDKTPDEIRAAMDIQDDLNTEQRSNLVQDTSWTVPYL